MSEMRPPVPQVTLPRRVFITGWISFVANVLIITTGGLVRLTGSGLGCPTWPTCDGSSIVTTPEMGIHGLIEFGNRMLTGVLMLAALAVIVSVWRLRKQRRDLWWLALAVLAGILAQAIVGGITVLVKLNPTIVGFHYIASIVLVCVTAAFLVRASMIPGAQTTMVASRYATLITFTAIVVGITVFVGVLTTGAGPHSGDPNAGRNGFNAELLEHIHAWPGYLTFVGALALFIGSFRYARHLTGWTATLLVVVLVQVAVGLWQARTGLPIALVAIHMTLAALLAAVMTVIVLRRNEPVEA